MPKIDITSVETALTGAFNAEISLLYDVFLNGVIDGKEQEALERFTRGLILASRARELACEAVRKVNSEVS